MFARRITPDGWICAGSLVAVTLLGLSGPVAAQDEAVLLCFEERGGNVATDSSGNGNDAELVGMDDTAWVPGVAGTAALRLDGDDDVVIVDAVDAIDLTGDFTWAFWIRSDGSDEGTIISKSPIDDEWPPGGIAIYLVEGQVVVDIGDVGELFSAAAVVDGTWHHVALVVERDTVGEFDTVQLYVDGNPDLSGVDWDLDSLEEPAGGQGELKLGFSSLDFTGWLDGELDDVRVWTLALNAEEVLDVFDAPGAGCLPNPLECDEVSDSRCVTVEVTARPEGDFAGSWRFRITAEDTSGDALFYTLTLDNGVDSPFDVTQFEDPEIEIRLRAGEYIVSASVDDSVFCDDSAPENTCPAVDVIVNAVPPGQVLEYCFEEREGLETLDTFNSIPAVFVDMDEGAWTVGAPTSGIAGLRFSGEGFLEIQGENIVDLDESFTIAAWLRTNEENAGTIFAQSFADEWPPGGRALFVEDGLLTLDVGFVGAVTSSGVTPLADGEWHHVAVTVERDAQAPSEFESVSLYIDGMLDASSEFLDFQSVDPPEGPLKIGFASFDFPESRSFFSGILDNVEVWNYALDADEVTIAVEIGARSCPQGPFLDCSDPADTRCGGITVAGPPDDSEGEWVFTVQASDDGLDPIDYNLIATSESGESVVRYQRDEPVFRVRLGEGVWEVEVTVDDDPFCNDALPEATCSTGAFSVEPLETDELLRFCMDEGEGLETVDSIDGAVGRLQNADEATAWIEGPFSEAAIALDGVDDFVLVDDAEDPIVDFGQDYSVAAWILSDGLSGGGTILARSPLGGSWDDPEALGSHALFLEGSTLVFDVSNITAVESSIPIEIGTWTHVATTFERDVDGSTDRVTLFVNGSLDAVLEEEDLQALGEPNGPLKFGYANEDFPDVPYFSGAIDEVRLFTGALNADQIAELVSEPLEECETIDPPEELFIRGDVNSDGVLNISDGVRVFDFLFLGGPPPPCSDAADSDDTGSLNITDGVFVLNFLFNAGAEPPAPFEECGEDPTEDGLAGCSRFPPCEG